MAFIQVIEMRTSHFDEIQKLEDKWREATKGKRTLRRAVVARDRNDVTRHFIIAFFDSYESAMENSQLPETSEFGIGQAEFLDGPPVFSDLEVLTDRE